MYPRSSLPKIERSFVTGGMPPGLETKESFGDSANVEIDIDIQVNIARTQQNILSK